MRTADCIVIGGGVVGCAAALRLAQAGVRTLVLERAIPGAEASSAAAGILAAQEESEGPGSLTELSLASRALFPGLAAELRELTGVDIGYRESGVLSAWFEESDRQRVEARYAWQRKAGHRLETLAGDDVRKAETGLSDKVIGGLWFPEDGQLEPRAYGRALSLAAAGAGVQFLTGAYVRRVAEDAGRVIGVEVEGERVAAPCVVVAAGSWSGLVEGIRLAPRAVRPVRGQIAQLETRPAAVRGTVISPRGGYILGRSDGRVLAGSTMEQVGFEKRVTAAGLLHVLRVATELVPGLADASVTDTWSNFRPATQDGLPILGPGALEGLVLATGHYRNGILQSAITAEIVRDLVTRRTPRMDLAPFSPSRAIEQQ